MDLIAFRSPGSGHSNFQMPEILSISLSPISGVKSFSNGPNKNASPCPALLLSENTIE